MRQLELRRLLSDRSLQRTYEGFHPQAKSECQPTSRRKNRNEIRLKSLNHSKGNKIGIMAHADTKRSS